MLKEQENININEKGPRVYKCQMMELSKKGPTREGELAKEAEA